MIDFKHFKNNLPIHVIDFLNLCHENMIEASLIGGISRDYLINQIIGQDFDICLRPIQKLADKDHFIKLIMEKYPQASEKKYGVIDLGNGIEISWPRIEKFDHQIGHSNFEVEIVQDLEHKIDVKRRDFTINAISFIYNGDGFILKDPLYGVEDIRNKILRACDNASFVKDPVRFLRAIRFHIKLDFDIDPTLKVLTENMELSFSAHYLKYEAMKTKTPLTFLIMAMYFRADHFQFDISQREKNQALAYEQAVTCTDLKCHLEGAYFLNKDLRLSIISLFQLGKSKLINFDPEFISLQELKNKELSELARLSFIKELIQFLERSFDFNGDYLTYLKFKEPFATSFYSEYLKLKISVPSEIDPQFRALYTFRDKLKALL